MQNRELMAGNGKVTSLYVSKFKTKLSIVLGFGNTVTNRERDAA